MRIHTNKLNLRGLYDCLDHAAAARLVAPSVFFTADSAHGSRSHGSAYEIQLGTYSKTDGPTRSRHYKNSGVYGASSVYAASYDEWGHFLARVFLRDRNAVCGPYQSHADFHAKTARKYETITDEHARDYAAHSGSYRGD